MGAEDLDAIPLAGSHFGTHRRLRMLGYNFQSRMSLGRYWQAALLAAVAAVLVGRPPLRCPPRRCRSRESRAATPRIPSSQRWNWNRQQAQVTATGDLAWAREPFHFEMGKSVRTSTSRPAMTPTMAPKQPWKHHPWDSAATGNAKACKGIQTYVFKRGVVYRGSLRPTESGTQANPMRLTSDPSWGEGEAIISGAEPLTGWKQGATAPASLSPPRSGISICPSRRATCGRSARVALNAFRWRAPPTGRNRIPRRFGANGSPGSSRNGGRTRTRSASRATAPISGLTPRTSRSRPTTTSVPRCGPNTALSWERRSQASRGIRRGQEGDHLPRHLVRRQRADPHQQPLLPGG